ncbi:unnamed protein product [Amoebophrya sp. A120]|nr:unnamed protein product [Amoebophrya sp. A120]|eukprot:GSA120T00017532001.1
MDMKKNNANEDGRLVEVFGSVDAGPVRTLTVVSTPVELPPAEDPPSATAASSSRVVSDRQKVVQFESSSGIVIQNGLATVPTTSTSASSAPGVARSSSEASSISSSTALVPGRGKAEQHVVEGAPTSTRPSSPQPISSASAGGSKKLASELAPPVAATVYGVPVANAEELDLRGQTADGVLAPTPIAAGLVTSPPSTTSPDPGSTYGGSPLIKRELFPPDTLNSAAPQTRTDGTLGPHATALAIDGEEDRQTITGEVVNGDTTTGVRAAVARYYRWARAKVMGRDTTGSVPEEYGLRQVDDYSGRSPEPPGEHEAFGLLEANTKRSSSLEDRLSDEENKGASPQLTIRLVAACLFQLPMGIIWSTIGLIVLPYEAEKFYPKAHSGFLGVLLTIAGTSQVISPIIGRLSDDHRSIFGRRRPFMIYGTLLTAIGVGGLSYCSAHVLVIMYAVSLFVSQVGLNVIYSATVLGLVPDTLEAQGLGTNNASASGIIAIFQFLGNLLGMLFMMGTATMAMENVYPFYLVSVLFTAAVVWICCPEESSLGRKRTRKDDGGGAAFYKALLFDASKEPDFFWVFVGRTLYYLSISCLSFIYYFVRDVGGVSDETTRKFYVALIVVCAQSTGALTAYPAGVLSDSVGRKRLVYLSCVMMALCYFWYLLIPYLPRIGSLHLLLLGSCIYGIAAGCYMSVDYALALDCLPDKSSKGSSEALGLWGISGFIGSYIGPMAGGSLLEVFGATAKKDHYSYMGYFALLSVGGLMALFSAWVTSFIKKAR